MSLTNKPANLPEELSSVFFVLNVCFLTSLLPVDCIFLSTADFLTFYITLFWHLLLYWCLQFWVLFNIFSDCLALSVASSMNYLLSHLTSGVMLNIWTAMEPGGLIYLVQGQRCPNSLSWHTVNPDFLPWWVIWMHACRLIFLHKITDYTSTKLQTFPFLGDLHKILRGRP